MTMPTTFIYLNRRWRLRLKTANGGLYETSSGEERCFDSDWLRRNVAQELAEINTG